MKLNELKPYFKKTELLRVLFWLCLCIGILIKYDVLLFCFALLVVVSIEGEAAISRAQSMTITSLHEAIDVMIDFFKKVAK